MFGYIKIYKPELKIKDFEIYQGIYCSLCKQLGKDYGITSRFLLNYDLTFLSLCLLSLNDNKYQFKKSNCTFCFAKKCLHCITEDDSLKYAAALTIITSYHKIIDNISDKKFLSKIPYFMVLQLIKHKYKKAKRFYPQIAEAIEIQIKNQFEFEKSGVNSIDRAAHSTATSLAEIITFAYNKKSDSIYRFGYCLGRFIYICDAIDDLEDDYKRKNYNPFLLNNNNTDFRQIREKCYSILDTTADELAKAYESINFEKNKSILDNIIFYGLDNTINKVLRKEENNNEKPI